MFQISIFFHYSYNAFYLYFIVYENNSQPSLISFTSVNNILNFQWVEIRENKVMGELLRVWVNPASALQHPAHRRMRHEPAHQDQREGPKAIWQVQGKGF